MSILSRQWESLGHRLPYQPSWARIRSEALIREMDSLLSNKKTTRYSLAFHSLIEEAEIWWQRLTADELLEISEIYSSLGY